MNKWTTKVIYSIQLQLRPCRSLLQNHRSGLGHRSTDVCWTPSFSTGATVAPCSSEMIWQRSLLSRKVTVRL